MTEIRLSANDQKLTVAVGPKVASGDKKSVYIRLIFSGHWNGFVKSAVFFTSWDKTVYEVLLENDECEVPWEVLKISGDLFIGVRGVNPDTQAVKTSALIKYRIEKGAPVGDATSLDPTPDVYQQILEKLNNISGVSFETDNTLILKDGVLSVNTTDQMEQDNTLPMTSAGVYATVGNIEALLKTI